MKKQFRTKTVWMAGILSVVMAAGTQAVVQETGRVTGDVIQPKEIHANEPFTFAVSGTVEGEVVQVQTVSGEVVQRGKADKLGRVFLPAGIPAGAYLVSAVSHGKPQQMVVAPSAAMPAGPLRLDPIPQTINVSEPLHLTGSGFSPNAADMAVNSAPVLAATQNEIVSPPNMQQAGMTQLTVSNDATGETVKSNPTLYYDLQGHLERRKLISGEQTMLRLNFEPKTVPVTVQAAVVEGPVNFGQGRATTTIALNAGVGLVPVSTNVGSSGPFTLAWTLYGFNPTAPATPREWLQAKADACAAASALSENSKNKKGLAGEAELDGKAAKDDKNWDKDGKPKSIKKFAEFLNDEIARLEDYARKEGEHAAAGKIAEAISAAYSAGTAAGLDLKKEKK